MGKNQPFNSPSEGSAGQGLRSSGVRTGGVRTGELQFHKPFVKIGREANAEPAEFHRTAIKTSRNEFPVEPAVASPAPLYITSKRPPYIAAGAPPAGGAKRYYLTWGTLNDQLATNWGAHHDITATTYFFAKAVLRTTSTLQVTQWDIVTGAAFDSHVTADWAVGADRPGEAVCLLGVVYVTVGAHSIENSGGGSLALTEHITQIEPGSGAGDTVFGKQLLFTRQNY